MAKKFGKFLLFSAAVGAAAAGVYYYLQKKNMTEQTDEFEDEDYDDFSEDLEDEDVNRNYVPLPMEKAAGDSATEETQATEATPATEETSSNTSNTTIEEFFDDDDELA